MLSSLYTIIIFFYSHFNPPFPKMSKRCVNDNKISLFAKIRHYNLYYFTLPSTYPYPHTHSVQDSPQSRPRLASAPNPAQFRSQSAQSPTPSASNYCAANNP